MTVAVKRGNGAKHLEKALKELERHSLKVGWVSGKQYPDSRMTTAQVAAVSEFGAPAKNIPPRPIIRPTIIKERNKWGKITTQESKNVISGKTTVKNLYEVLGNFASGDIRKMITTIKAPPLKPATIRARERTYTRKSDKAERRAQIAQRMQSTTLAKPLVFTKALLNSCTYEVSKA
jgi:hypothetical protein